MLVHDDAADVLAVHQVLITLLHLVEAVPGGDELIQLELARPVHVEHPRNLLEGVAPAEQGALDPLSEQGQLEAGVGDLDVWWLASYGGGMFVPIRNTRTDGATYPGGRYVLDTAERVQTSAATTAT